MKVTIEFDDERGTRARITMKPSWLGRLFGAQSRVARIFLSDGSNDWRFVDGEWVGSALEARIKHERRWRAVADLPSASVLETSKHA